MVPRSAVAMIASPRRPRDDGAFCSSKAHCFIAHVRQNIQFLRENLVLSDALMDEIATAKLEMVGCSLRMATSSFGIVGG